MDTNNENVQQTNVQNEDVKTEQVSTTDTDNLDKTKSDDTHKDNENETDKEREKTLKALDKMKARISAEAGKKNEYKDKLADTEKQVADLTKQLNALRSPESRDKLEKEDGKAELDKANATIADLQAQIEQSKNVQFAYDFMQEHKVPISKDIARLVAQKGISRDQLIDNLQAVSNFYYDTAAATRKDFMTAETPRIGGSSTKKMSKSDIAKVTDPNERIKLISENKEEFR